MAVAASKNKRVICVIALFGVRKREDIHVYHSEYLYGVTLSNMRGKGMASRT